MTWFTQVKQHAVALFSLAIALTALFYNGYRQETTEDNRNRRQAGFELLRALAGLQSVTDFAHYRGDNELGDPIIGWTYVTTIRDLSFVMGPEVEQQAQDLFMVWQANWSALTSDPKAEQAVSSAITTMRLYLREDLKALD